MVALADDGFEWFMCSADDGRPTRGRERGWLAHSYNAYKNSLNIRHTAKIMTTI